MDYREEIKQLRDALNEHGYKYYVLDSPTQRIGGKPLEGFASYTHEVPLESLQDVFSGEEVAEFCERMNEALGVEATYSLEPKVDGLSVALEYREGVFVRRADRGGCDGEPENHPLHSNGTAGQAAPAYCPGRGLYVSGRL